MSFNISNDILNMVKLANHRHFSGKQQSTSLYIVLSIILTGPRIGWWGWTRLNSVISTAPFTRLTSSTTTEGFEQIIDVPFMFYTNKLY